MKFVYSIFAFAAAIVFANAVDDCVTTIKMSKSGITYEFGTSKNWYQASDYCRSRGMHIATIASQDESDMLMKYINKCQPGVGFWIGATDLGDEGTFRWESNGQTVGYAAWGPGEPNDAGSNEDCAAFGNGAWNDYICDEPLSFICKKQC